MNRKANEALNQSLRDLDPAALQTALENGADPYATGTKYRPILYQIIDLPSCYTSKLDYVRPLVQAGNNFDLIRERTALSTDENFFDQRVLYLGYSSHREGDEECAAFLLANLIAYDLEENRGYQLPIDQALEGMGGATKIPGDIKEDTRMNVAKAITRNQHALVDYVATSKDPVAAFLRTCSDYPDADVWMKKIAPVDPDQYSRPTQEYLNAIKHSRAIAQERTAHLNNPDMARILSIDYNMQSAAMEKMTRSWKPPLPPADSKPNEPKPD